MLAELQKKDWAVMWKLGLTCWSRLLGDGFVCPGRMVHWCLWKAAAAAGCSAGPSELDPLPQSPHRTGSSLQGPCSWLATLVAHNRRQRQKMTTTLAVYPCLPPLGAHCRLQASPGPQPPTPVAFLHQEPMWNLPVDILCLHPEIGD